MLVSHRKKFIYTKTAKTAGTSVESYFEKYCMPEGEWTPEHSRDVYESETGIIGFRGKKKPADCPWYNHMPADQIKAGLGEETWNSYLKFCVIRDPFDKAVSAFFHFKKARQKKGVKRSYQSIRHCLLSLLPEPKFASVAEEFEHWLKIGAMPLDRNKYTINGEFCLDSVIRFEKLHEGMAEICEKIGETFDPESLPQMKRGTRDESVSLSQIYTPRSIAIISKLYDYEIKTFGYEAPSLD